MRVKEQPWYRLSQADRKARTLEEAQLASENRAREQIDSLHFPIALMKGYMLGYPREWRQVINEYMSMWDTLLDLAPAYEIVFGRTRPKGALVPPVDKVKPLRYSPLGVLLAVQVYQPVVDFVRATPKASLKSIATDDEFEGISAVFRRGEHLADWLQKGKDAIYRKGWQLDSKGKLKSVPRAEGGEPGAYLRGIVGDLWEYLRPIYKQGSGDTTMNAPPLRQHIALLLIPFFPHRELGIERKGSIGSAIDYRIKHPV